MPATHDQNQELRLAMLRATHTKKRKPVDRRQGIILAGARSRYRLFALLVRLGVGKKMIEKVYGVHHTSLSHFMNDPEIQEFLDKQEQQFYNVLYQHVVTKLLDEKGGTVWLRIADSLAKEALSRVKDLETQCALLSSERGSMTQSPSQKDS